MASNVHENNRILGTLRAENGHGAVRMQDRFNTDIEDLWSAFTDPSRLARWLGEVEGDFRLGGEFRARFFATGWEGMGRVEVCEAPHRLMVTMEEQDKPGEVHETEAILTADGDGTLLVLEERGMPVGHVAGYGAGVQMHVEDLASYIAGRDPRGSTERWEELFPVYKQVTVDGI